MTRVDEHGIPCIVQSVELNKMRILVNLFDGTTITAPYLFYTLFMKCSDYNLDKAWGAFYSSVDGWANMAYRQLIREAKHGS